MSLPRRSVLPTDFTLADRARFWGRVRHRGAGCWPFGDTAPDHHASFTADSGVTYPAHRVAYVLARGPIPMGLYVCHHCDNKPCVRPDHLFLGTARDNTQDWWRKGHRGYPHRLRRR